MKLISTHPFILLLLVLLFFNHTSWAHDHQKVHARTDFMFQYSIIDALLAGVYDGDMTFGELKNYGSFGIGTFNQIHGEMMLIDGNVYRMSHDGKVEIVADSEKTPLAFVNFFNADTVIRLNQIDMTMEDITRHLDSILNGNMLYAIQIKGHFKTVSARSVKPASYPYTSLAEHIQNGGQVLLNFQNVKGVCGGYSLPPYMARTNVPGFHLHFISDARDQGGHLYNFTTDKVEILVDVLQGFIVENNTNEEFQNIDLYKNREQELHKVEK